ncbi:response regulator [Gynurincola endophyticus]|jgi:two-component system KDP operon response regulator KdpE|uniref:response regulator n=1 Tax=Gynurincola endophyticus TaxID=2479004 RepID=UPI000F8C4796|nr:response regulator transcription factor [Gynurincola endophyticus]
MNKPTILIIDDEPQIRRLLEINFVSNGYLVRQAASGKEGLLLAANLIPDIIVLDLGLPDIKGHEVLKVLREWYTKPILILSVQSNENDIIDALDQGANDYLTKPFRVGELMARIRSASRNKTTDETTQILEAGNIEIDLVGRVVKFKGEVLKLTATEYSLLVMLVKNEGKVLTHQFLLKEIWGMSFQAETQYLRVFIAQLRKKIEENPNHPQLIITESGIGYRFQQST